MTDFKIYRITGACSLASIAVFLIEFPFYLIRGPFPAVTESIKLQEFTAHNGTNIMACVFLDLIILGLLMVFMAGFRHLMCRADSTLGWLVTLFFGVGLVYVGITLMADSLQAATVVDALTVPPDPVAIRTMLESMYLMYGSVALFLMALLMAIARYATQIVSKRAHPILPRWSAHLGYVCSFACLAFAPSMFVGRPDPNSFYNPAGWGPLGIAAGFPLASWMVVMGILMVRMEGDVAGEGRLYP
jgi:hypothetical protein